MSGKNTPYINFWNWHSNHSKSDEFARKKSIIIHDLNWCQKLPGIILVNSTNFILKNILVKVPFWAKTMVPYESRKREKIHISYIVHRRKISLTESRGSRSFFILKSGVHFSFWARLNFSYLLRPTSSEFYRKGQMVRILVFHLFSTTFGSSFIPPWSLYRPFTAISISFPPCGDMN